MDADGIVRLRVHEMELRSFDKETRRRAVLQIGQLGKEPEVLTTLRTILINTTEDQFVRANAATMLGRLKDENLVCFLTRTLMERGYHLPLASARALGMIGDSQAEADLICTRELTSSDNIRSACEISLTQIRNRLLVVIE